MKEILELIEKYQAYVSESVNELQKAYDCTDLLSSWQQGQIPQSGTLNSGIEYQFHGVGCAVNIHGVEVDFDFGPNGRSDGFDVWRLSLFVEENPHIHNIYSKNLKQIDMDFKTLIDRNIVYRPEWFPGSSLYYFVKE